MNSHQPIIDLFREAVHLPCREHNSPQPIRFPNSRSSMPTHFGRKNLTNMKFGAHAEQQSVDARRVTMSQFGEITDPHHDLDLRMTSPKLKVTGDRLGKTKMNGVQNRIDDERAPPLLKPCNHPIKGIKIAMGRWDQDGCGRHLIHNPKGLLGETQEKVSPSPPTHEKVFWI